MVMTYYTYDELAEFTDEQLSWILNRIEEKRMGQVNKSNVIDVFTYHSPSPEMVEKMEMLRAKQIELATMILDVVPECADRSNAIRDLRNCRMGCNSAIVLNGLI